jgi:DMSO/TMAO reductase YedYZ heme-binding membrane subunit
VEEAKKAGGMGKIWQSLQRWYYWFSPMKIGH